ncbi:probable cytochrome P450 6a13 [Bacillus rossius redtenbacheri]|uniref:probable cytochrome P450 6a13 n=1 Tax=Bacillus rossius redtenbacheri TaxID=93214 RepID=UPI002FDDF3B4
MGFFFSSLLWELFIVIVAVVGYIYYFFTSTFNYWKRRGVAYVKPLPIVGNLKDMAFLRTTQAEGFKDLYFKFVGERFAGLYQTRIPMLMLRDPELIKQVLIKDFSHFHDRGMPHDIPNDPITGNLVILEGAPWRSLRTTLNPAFNASKMRMLFHLVSQCADQLAGCLDEVATSDQVVDLRDFLARFATDVIGTCAFGVDCNSMRDPESEFRKFGERIISPPTTFSLARLLRYSAPGLLKMLGIRIFDKDMTDFFIRVVKDALDYREKNHVQRKDFLQLLINMKNNVDVNEDDDEEEKEQHRLEREADRNNLDYGAKGKWNYDIEFDDNMIAAQVCVFFLGGFETASTTMSFCLYELALNTDLQRRVREEVDQVVQLHGGKITYNTLQDMEYLDLVIKETLRKYPALPNLIRVCTKEYRIPDSDVTVEKGTPIIVPIYSIQRDPQYYTDPERFDPERFREDNVEKRPPYTYMPFGEGPRICIGLRFGMMTVKMGLSTMLSRYEFSVCDKTAIPLQMDTTKFVMNTVGGIWLQVQRRQQ